MSRDDRAIYDALEVEPLLVIINYASKFGLASLGFAVLALFWNDMFLVDMSKYLYFDASGIVATWYVLAFGAVAALLVGGGESYESRGTLFGRAIWLSANAGFWEEIIYRVLYFLGAMVLLPFLNFITFGLVKWLYMSIFIPVANFITFGLMHEYLYTTNWVLGAALISSLADFRDAHERHNFVGKIIVWYIGMLLFWLMFNYGILTAIVVHFLYDAIVLGIRALMAQKPSLLHGWSFS